ncbi:cytochrome P450 [Thalassobaculum sp.]|uniref:cytochrome P450 n=1 Tax=Thalassobaculum sp. TaxID=2022740 RepID=UPI0032EB0EA8
MSGPAAGTFDAPAVAAGFDLAALDRDFLDDPYPTYRALREHDPVHRMPDGSVFLARYADCLAVYRDRRLLSDKTREFGPKYGVGSPLYRHHTTSLVFNDPPLHTRVRSLLMPAFTPRALTTLQPKLEALVDRLLDRIADKREFDLIADLAAAVPVQVIGDLLAIPMAERGPLRDWSLAILGALEPRLSDAQMEQGNRAVTEFTAYLDALVADRRRNLVTDGSDVLSTLIAGQGGDTLDRETLGADELAQNCIFLLNAGHETTTNLIGNGVAALLDNPGELARLRADPGLINGAVEEFLRYESSNQLGNRRVGERLELAGAVLEPGTYVHIGIGAANRDPAAFPDPDRLDVTRSPNRHLAFGSGAHACAGMSLARMEGRVAIGRLVARFPRLERAGDPVRGGRARFRGFLGYPMRVA